MTHEQHEQQMIQLVADSYETLTYDDVAKYVRLYRQEHPTADVLEALKVFRKHWEAFLTIMEERETAIVH
jgi:hypothetical protein